MIQNIQMDSVSSVVGFVIVWAISAGVTGMLAARKNRSAVAWAILGGIVFPGTGLVVLLFMSYLCPKCQHPIAYDEWKQKDCPRCRSIRPDQENSERKDFLECPSCHAMIPPAETKCPKCGWS